MLYLPGYGLAVGLGVICALGTMFCFWFHYHVSHPDEVGEHATVLYLTRGRYGYHVTFKTGDKEHIRLEVRASVFRSLHVGDTGMLRVYKGKLFKDFTPDQ